MYNRITLDIPSETLYILNRTPNELSQDMRLYASLMLYQLGKLSAGAAAEMAGVPKVVFLDNCSDYGISASQITPEELRAELT